MGTIEKWERGKEIEKERERERVMRARGKRRESDNIVRMLIHPNRQPCVDCGGLTRARDVFSLCCGVAYHSDCLPAHGDLSRLGDLALELRRLAQVDVAGQHRERGVLHKRDQAVHSLVKLMVTQALDTA